MTRTHKGRVRVRGKRGSSPRRAGMSLFLGVVGVAIGLMVVLLVVDVSFTSVTSEGLFKALAEGGLAAALGSLAEVLAAVLGLSLTVVAIVVQLAAQRYSPKIVDLFLRDPANIAAFGFMVVSCIYVVLMPAFAGTPQVPEFAVAAALVLAVINIGVLLPYFWHVFDFLQPDNIITQIEVGAERSLDHARTGRLPSAAAQDQVAAAIERIADNCVAALSQSDRRLALHSIRTLERFVSRYLKSKRGLPSAWARVSPEVLFTLSEEFYEELVDQGGWVEAKALMEFEHVFRRALGEMNELVSQVASSTRLIGESAMEAADEEALWLAVRFFNTYVRHALNARNVRAVYNVLYQYRQLSTTVMSLYPAISRRVVEYLVYYGRTANAMGLPFATVTTAHDVRVLCELAHTIPHVDVLPLVELFLSLDQDPEGKIEELALVGVRKAQSILGAYFLEHGAEDLVQRIREDMCEDAPARLKIIRDAILAVDERRFWEVTDRGFNFDYVPPERHHHIRAFFQPLIDRQPGQRFERRPRHSLTTERLNRMSSHSLPAVTPAMLAEARAAASSDAPIADDE